MNSDTQPELTVLGGGPAGLATGLYGRRAGLDVRLLEANDTVGGNARTLQFGPFRYDTGAHRFHDKNDEITADVFDLLGDDLRRVDAPSQICWRGKRIDFPLAPYDLLRKLPLSLLARIAREQLSIPRYADDADDFEEMALDSYGETLANLFLLNYTEKLWGADADTLSPSVAGDRLEGLDLKTFVLEAFGGRQDKARHLDGSFYYPRHGYGQIAEATADALGREHIRTGARITTLHHAGDRLTHVTINNEETVPAQRVVSTLPLTLLIRLLTPAAPDAVQTIADSIRFRHLRLAVLGLDTPRLTPNASLYFPSRDIPFTRLYEPKNRSPDMAPDDQTVVVLELPCNRGEEAWAQSPDALRESARSLLAAQGLTDDTDVVAFEYRTVPFAYPILKIGSDEKAEQLRTYLGRFKNLHLLGRSAHFRYTHVHNLYARAKSLTRRLAETTAALSPPASG